MVKPAGGAKKHRRGRGKKKNVNFINNKAILYHLNIRGFNSKQNSLGNILRKISPTIITLNETALKDKQKPKLKNFVAFSRNRTDQIMGGVAMLVKSEF